MVAMPSLLVKIALNDDWRGAPSETSVGAVLATVAVLPLARGVVGADHRRREPASVLADRGQLVNVLDPPRGFEDQLIRPARTFDR
jgi:hypothetical protein